MKEHLNTTPNLLIEDNYDSEKEENDKNDIKKDTKQLI